MKVVIDIPDSAYKKLMKFQTLPESIDLEYFIIHGTPLEEELEKIKTEIQGLIDFEESCCGNITLGYQCLGVIEDIISELKGENKE